MAAHWTPEHVASLAPDASSLKAAQGLASPQKWVHLGRDADFLWGLAQGSGKLPYQAQIDLREPAFKCSCPSRKFPCKHGLGLLLIFASKPSGITEGSRPDWVAEWAAKRAERAAKQEAKTEQKGDAAATPDPEAQAKRREKRTGNMTQGVLFLEAWLRDLVRQGLTATSASDYAFWDAPARRLIDAQTPGLARRLRSLGSKMLAGGQNGDQVISELGRLHMLVSASQRSDSLPETWQQELQQQLGLTVDQDELRKKPGIKDTWLVAGQTVREEDKIITRCSYLCSTSGRTAKILEFSPAARPAVSTMALGRWLEGELVYYPGIQQSRALWKTTPQDGDHAPLPFVTQCEAILEAYAAEAARNPLTEALPVLTKLIPQQDENGWWVLDESSNALPLHPAFKLGWELLACSGGAAIPLFSLWDGFTLLPLTLLANTTPIQLSERAITA